MSCNKNKSILTYRDIEQRSFTRVPGELLSMLLACKATIHRLNATIHCLLKDYEDLIDNNVLNLF